MLFILIAENQIPKKSHDESYHGLRRNYNSRLRELETQLSQYDTHLDGDSANNDADNDAKGKQETLKQHVKPADTETNESKTKSANEDKIIKQRRVIECEVAASSKRYVDVELEPDVANHSVHTPFTGVEDKRSRRDDVSPPPSSSTRPVSGERREVSPGTCSKLKLARGEKRNRLRYTEVL